MTMRDDLDHLPAAAREELTRVVRILFCEFEDALAGRRASHRKAGRILKVILFGSYARGDWVSDPVGGYFSDYDILVVVNHEELADAEYWRVAEDHLLRELHVADTIRTPVNLIVHSLGDVNRQLHRGRPFFVDIVRDGIALYEAPDHPFDAPKLRLAAEVEREARGYFNDWFGSALAFWGTAPDLIMRSRPKEAAFLLHQATERLYHCTLLVLTLYSPKSHKLAFLRSQAERLAPSLIAAWPRDSRVAQRSFELLRRAYVDARYSPHYRISDDELAWLVERVGVLAELVRQTCEDHLAAMPRDPEDQR